MDPNLTLIGRNPYFSSPLDYESTPSQNEECNPIDIEKYLSVEDEYGNTQLHDIESCKHVLSLASDMTVLAKYLIKKNQKGETPLHDPKICKILFPQMIPIMEPLINITLVGYLSIQNTNGRTPLHNAEIWEIFMPLMNKLDKKFMIRLLSIQDDEGNTPLHFAEVCAKFSECLRSLNINKAVPPDIIVKNSLEARTAQFCIPIYMDINKNDNSNGLEELLKIQNHRDCTPLHNPEIVRVLTMHLLSDIPSSVRNKLFSIQDCDGNTPLHDNMIYSMSVPFELPFKYYLINNKAGVSPIQKNT